MKSNPIEYLSLPINGKPYITKNNRAIMQNWCSNHNIRDVLNRHGEFKKMEEYPPGRRPVYFELTEFLSTLSRFVSSSQYSCGRTHEGCLREIGTKILDFNMYGRIIHRKARGCANFYKLLRFEEKKDGWEAACRGMERDLLEFDPNSNFDSQTS